MSNKKIWTTRDGRTLKISEMTDNHLVNTINFCQQKGVIPDVFPDLLEEASKRGLEVPIDKKLILLIYLERELTAMYNYSGICRGEMALEQLDRDIHMLEELREDLSNDAIYIEEVEDYLGRRILPVSTLTGKLRKHNFQELF